MVPGLSLTLPAAGADPADLKSCCASLYESDVARLLLGDSFHPGGVKLSTRLGELMGLRAGMHVLDVAAGRGATAIHLAKTFGCDVTGVDYGGGNVARATEAAAAAGVSDRVRFQQGDAERLEFADGAFDAVVCECAFCTFPDKPAAAAHVFRVLRPGGVVGISDLTRAGELPPELNSLLAWIACIADARPIAEYQSVLQAAGLKPGHTEPHDDTVRELIGTIRIKMMGAQLMAKLGKISLPDIDWAAASNIAKSADQAVIDGKLGYAILLATRPA